MADTDPEGTPGWPPGWPPAVAARIRRALEESAPIYLAHPEAETTVTFEDSPVEDNTLRVTVSLWLPGDPAPTFEEHP